MNYPTMLLTALGTLWTLAIFVGGYAMISYEVTPGLSAAPTDKFPASSKVRLSKTKCTLIMLAHPLCPCTEASITELEKIMSRHGSKLEAYILFLAPSSPPPEWNANSATRRKAESARGIRGIRIIEDIDGSEAKIFSAKTSGECLLYNTDGDLLFNGGLTAARGTTGDNENTRSLVSILESQPATAHRALVFGCPLTSSRNR